MACSFLQALTLTAALTGAMIKGSSADPCNGRCGQWSLCKHTYSFNLGYHYVCNCEGGFAILTWHGWVHVCYAQKSTTVRDPLTTQSDSTVINTDTSTNTTGSSSHSTSLTSVSKTPMPITNLTSVSGKRDPNTGDKSSLLTTGLAAGIGAVVLLALAVLAVVLVKKRRQRTKGKGESGHKGSPTATGSGDGSAYVNVIDVIPQQERHGANNPTYSASTLPPDLLSSNAQFQSGGTARAEDNKGGYEKVDLPPHPGMTRATLCRYSLAGAFIEQQTSEEPEINEMYYNHNIVKNKWNESAGEKISTDGRVVSDIVYNVLTTSNANPSSASARDIPDHYNTLSDVKAGSINESQLHI